MRTYEEIIKEIKIWGCTNEEISVILLTGSRANPGACIDLFSDYDIEIVVHDRNKFLINQQWFDAFGKILTSIYEDQGEFSMRMILYEDYVRIDFKIYELSTFEKYKENRKLPDHWDNGFNVLVDKNETCASFKVPSYTAFIIHQPNEVEYLQVVTDFWWDLTYVGKSLWRREIFYAKYMLDSVIRIPYLQKMIEWYIGFSHNWQITTNKNGRHFEKYLDTDTWAKLQTTYAGSNVEENWDALIATTLLFRKFARDIGAGLNYCYPQQVDVEITTFLEKIKRLDLTAKDIL